MPFGLVTSEVLDDFWANNTRRQVFQSYPNGTAPLTGLLSLTDTQSTPLPQYGWEEKRWLQRRTTTVGGGGATVTFTATGTTTTVGGTFTPTAGTAYRVYLTDATQFQVDDVFVLHGLILNSGGLTTELQMRVIATGATFVEAQAINTTGVVKNDATAIGVQAVSAGQAFAEGSRSRTGRYNFPSEIVNYTQIFKNAFDVTGTALKAPLKFDRMGNYRTQLKETGIDHLAGIEWNLFFGNRRTEVAVDADSGSNVRRSYFGGLLWYLKQWELGAVANSGAFDYGQPNVSTQTDFIAYPNKRIIRQGGVSMNLDSFNAMEALPFERTNSTEFCKLCLCGPGYIAKVNSRLEKQVTKYEMRGEQYAGWDFKVVQRTSLAGDVYYKQHPLFASPEMRNSAFYIDLGYLKYRPLNDRDTDIQEMIQLPDADVRKDQWLTECGFEIPYPEAHMFVENIGTITA